MQIVISIKTEYLNKIRSGIKKWELRKKLPEDKIISGEIDKIWVWETSPISKVVGYIEIGELKKDKPDILWHEYGKEFGVEKNFYDNYYKNKNYAIAIEIKNWVDTDFFNNAKIVAPQGYIYINNAV
jgi:predicted transcriptional regulator